MRSAPVDSHRRAPAERALQLTIGLWNGDGSAATRLTELACGGPHDPRHAALGGLRVSET